MAALSWNEVKDRAVRFSKEWENETSEDAEAKSFLDGFLTCLVFRAAAWPNLSSA